MLFIGGISQGRKLLNYARSILCGSCGSTSQCQVFMTYMYFSFFFIPLFKWNKRFCADVLLQRHLRAGAGDRKSHIKRRRTGDHIRRPSPGPGRKIHPHLAGRFRKSPQEVYALRI